MAKTPSKRTRASNSEPAVLTFTQSLQFKLGILFLLALLLLAAGAYLASRTLVQEKLLDESFRYEQEAGLRLTAEMRTLIGDAQSLAGTLANLAADSELRLEQLRGIGPQLLKHRPSAPLVVSLGIWPEPNKFAGVGQRGSLYWLRAGDSSFSTRNDYNDSRSAPYYQERWYTPARYLTQGRGSWTHQRREPLLDRDVLTYIVPIWRDRDFVGVVTVSLDAASLNDRFSVLASDERSYALLLDGGLGVIGLSSKAATVLGNKARRGMTIAELAKAEPAYSELALSTFARSDAQRAAMMQSKRYDATQVSALKEATRELSRQEADDILSDIWAAETPKAASASGERTSLSRDVVLGDAAWASLFELGNPGWTLLRITPANQGYAGASYLFQQSLVMTLGLSTLTLLVAFFVLRTLVIRPLQLMTNQLAGSQNIEEAVNIILDASSRNEMGVLAHWQNERIRQLRDAIDQARAVKAQLASEALERRQAQEQLAQVQDRAKLALQLVSDAVVTTDARGLVEDMNLAAEQLCGITLRESRGRPLAEIVRLRLNDGETYQDLALQAMERGTPLDFKSGLSLLPHSGPPRELVLNGSPLQLRQRMVGAVLVFHERIRDGAAGEGSSGTFVSRHQYDLLTGLATRAACERRITLLLEQGKVSGLTHGLLFLDVDHLKRINDKGGLAAGDDVLVRVAETLTMALQLPGEVYRIAADQFALVVESLDAAGLLRVGEQMRVQLAGTRFYWESNHFSLTASFGALLLNREVATASEAIRRADDACLAAKRAGRNTVVAYAPGMDRVGSVIDDDSWVRCIRRGLSENLFHLRTQWIMPSRDYTNEGQCFEVLLALEDEEGFWASPAAFMPVAERHHLITAIDRWVIARALHYLEDHPEIVTTMAFCSINLSSATLADPEFLDFITECFSRYPQLLSKICFEIGEPTLTDHPREATLCCDVLHRMGCRLSIDHYQGRDLSDLGLLRRLPIDFVKLNAQGFKNLGSEAVEQMLAESILRIVRHMRRRIVVNNIDDASTMEIWQKMGVDYFQGYAYAKPSPVPFLAPD